MRIVHIGTQKTWRGGENQLLNLAIGSKDAGHNVTIVGNPKSELVKRSSAAGINTITISLGHEFLPFGAYRLSKVLKSLNADVCHSHDGHGVAIAGNAARWAKTPLSLTTRRVDFPIKRIGKYKKLDGVICISEAIRNVCSNSGLDASKMPIVHSGIDKNVLFPKRDRDEVRSELGLKENELMLFNAGALTDHKGQTYALQAMKEINKHCKAAKLFIAGAGELEASLKNEAAQLNLPEGVIVFLGFRTDIKDLLGAADIFVMPSHLEGLGTSVIEAMMCSLPVVGTNAGGIPEIIENKKTGFVVPAKNPSELANACIKLLNSSELRNEFGSASVLRAEEVFSTKAMVQGTLKVYEQWL